MCLRNYSKSYGTSRYITITPHIHKLHFISRSPVSLGFPIKVVHMAWLFPPPNISCPAHFIPKVMKGTNYGHPHYSVLSSILWIYLCLVHMFFSAFTFQLQFIFFALSESLASVPTLNIILHLNIVLYLGLQIDGKNCENCLE